MPRLTFARHHRTRAFTLIELLVVISIIMLLIGILLPAMAKARKAVGQAKCLSQIRSIGFATATYQADNQGYYPHGYKSQSGQPINYTQAINSYLGLTPPNSTTTTNNYDGWHCPETSDGRQVWAEAGIYGHNPNLMPYWDTATTTYNPYHAPEYPNQYIRDDHFGTFSSSKLAVFIDCKRPTFWNPPNAPNIAINNTDYIFPHQTSRTVTWTSAAYREPAGDGTAGVMFADGHSAPMRGEDFNTWTSSLGVARIYSFTVK